jgi:heat shock protein HtpX
LFYGLVVGLDLISTFIITGIAVSALSSILLVGPLVYWLIGRGFSALRIVGSATFLAALLAIPGLLAVALLVLAVLSVTGITSLAYSSLAYLAAVLLVLFVVQYLLAPYLVLYTSKARRPGAGEEWVVELFEEVKRSSGYRGEVELYIVDTPVPNAFAVGNVFKKAVVVHSGLLRVLDRGEVKAVLAHELGHIAHRDNAYMIAVSLTPFFAYVVGLLSLLFGVGYIMGTVKGAQRTIEYAKSRGEREEEVALGAYFGVLIAIVIGLIAIMVGLLLTVASYLANIGVLAFSRVREHLADMYSVRVTGDTRIASALLKIERAIERMVESGEVGFQPSVKKALYIIPMAYGELTGTSPPSLVRLVKYIKTEGPRRPQPSLIKYIKMSSPLSTHPSVEARLYVVSSYYRELTSKRLLLNPKA